MGVHITMQLNYCFDTYMKADAERREPAVHVTVVGREHQLSNNIWTYHVELPHEGLKVRMLEELGQHVLAEGLNL